MLIAETSPLTLPYVNCELRLGRAPAPLAGLTARFTS